MSADGYVRHKRHPSPTSASTSADAITTNPSRQPTELPNTVQSAWRANHTTSGSMSERLSASYKTARSSDHGGCAERSRTAPSTVSLHRTVPIPFERLTGLWFDFALPNIKGCWSETLDKTSTNTYYIRAFKTYTGTKVYYHGHRPTTNPY